MSVLISGVLTDGAGLPMSGHHIILKARQNTSAVVMRTVATVVTGPAGEYAFEAQTGRYDVYLRSCIEREYCVGDISVYNDSKPGTLNDFLTTLDEGDLKPDVVKRFEELVAQAHQSAEAAAESEQQAGQHAEAASLIKEQVEALADNVQQNAEAVAASKQQVEQLASQVEDTVEEVRKDTEAAKQAASDAEQARDDIETALSATLKTANRLSEIAAAGQNAQQESRYNLGLKDAATMDVQSSIYDRTEGRVAIPGTLGYGAYYRTKKTFSAQNGPAEFLSWVQETPPGKYVVTQNGGANYKPIINGTTNFTGIIEIQIPDVLDDDSNQKNKDKKLTFENVNGETYSCMMRAVSSAAFLTDWINESLQAGDVLSALLSKTNTDGDPGLNGLILAAYQGNADNDAYITLTRGASYSGSSLTVVSISVLNNRNDKATSTPTVTTRGCRGWHLPGVYTALSGAAGNATGDKAIIGLFMRVR
ncbi:TPA: prophage tail fiber N-terminal domain-containing protein [Escherichia coli]